MRVEDDNNIGLTKCRYRDWLEHHQPYDIVGYGGDCGHSPIAAYLRSLGYETQVGLDYIQFGVRERIGTPPWVMRYLVRIDNLAAVCRIEPVNAAVALFML